MGNRLWVKGCTNRPGWHDIIACRPDHAANSGGAKPLAIVAHPIVRAYRDR